LFQLIFDFIFKPYFNRVKKGEGGLVVFGVTHSIVSQHGLAAILAESLLCFFTLCVLYGFNDYKDRYHDLSNPKKEQKFVRSIIQHQQRFLLLNTLAAFSTIALALYIFGPEKFYIITALYLVNYSYSLRLKTVPVMDLFIVGLWGGLLGMLGGQFNLYLFLIVGVMTAIAHLFQIITDKKSDQENALTTTVVAISGSETASIIIICALLTATLFLYTESIWSLGGFIPAIAYFLIKRISLGWHISRFYFFVCWIYLLTYTYAGQ